MTVKLLEVSAPPGRVSEVLAARFSAEELAAIRISASTADPFAPEPLRDVPAFQTILDFTAGAVTSGVTYDLLKKAAIALREAFGSNEVREGNEEDEIEEGEPEEAPEHNPNDPDGER